MANLFETLPTTAANGAGAAVDVTDMGATKTIVVKGNGSGNEPFASIEISNDDAGLIWSPLVYFREPGSKTVNVACRFMRAVTSHYTSGGALTIAVGSTDAGTQAAELIAPAGNGNGAGVDISELGDFTTVQVSGVYQGSANIEVSTDGGATYALAPGMSFMSRNGITRILSANIAGDFMRVSRAGVYSASMAGLPVVDVCGSEIGPAAGEGAADIGTGTPGVLPMWNPAGDALVDSPVRRYIGDNEVDEIVAIEPEVEVRLVTQQITMNATGGMINLEAGTTGGILLSAPGGVDGSGVQIAGDGELLGFFGANAIARPTGVAIEIGAVWAALIVLGLIEGVPPE